MRRAGPQDAAGLAAIGRAAFIESFGHLYAAEDLEAFLNEAHSEARAQADLADGDMAAWLAEVDGRAVGYALAGPCSLPHPAVAEGDGELKRLYLLARAQNGGLGARLMQAAMDWLERDGPRVIWIGVWSENLGAQRFYRRWGFLEVGAYDFLVGRAVDHELILRRVPEFFFRNTPATA